MNALEQVRASLRAKLDERKAKADELDAVLSAPTTEGRSLNDDETKRFTEVKDALAAIDTEADALVAREAELTAEAERRAAADALAARLPAPPAVTGTGGGAVRVTSEPLTYRQGGEHNFLQDAYLARFGHDRKAEERLLRHTVEQVTEYRSQGIELRDVSTSAVAALVVPQYLTDLYAAKRRAGRKFLDTINGSVPLPDEGETINIPRITTGTAAAAQATQNSAVQETDVDDTTLAVSVRTFAGQQDVSRQALERGRMVEAIIVADLIKDYEAKVNASAIAADGTSGTHLGVLSTSGIIAVTYTDASPTVAELYPKVADAIQQINSTDFLDADTIWMHPRRWGWLTAAVDSTGRPLVTPKASNGQNSTGQNDAPGSYSALVVGTMHGLNVVTDAAIPTNLGAGTNEDRVIVGDSSQALIMEEPGAPKYLRFEETSGGNLTVKLVVYGYSAFTAGRYPTAFGVISGTGLVAPTF